MQNMKPIVNGSNANTRKNRVYISNTEENQCFPCVTVVQFLCF